MLVENSTGLGIPRLACFSNASVCDFCGLKRTPSNTKEFLVHYKIHLGKVYKCKEMSVFSPTRVPEKQVSSVIVQSKYS